MSIKVAPFTVSETSSNIQFRVYTNLSRFTKENHNLSSARDDVIGIRKCVINNAMGERSGSVVECLTRDRMAVGSSLNGVTAMVTFVFHYIVKQFSFFNCVYSWLLLISKKMDFQVSREYES